MPATQRGPGRPARPATAGDCATTTPHGDRARKSVPVQVGGARPLPRRDRAGAPRRDPGAARADAGRVRAALPGAPRGQRPAADDRRRCASGSRYAIAAFGDVPLRDLERMSGEIASWRATPARALPLRRSRRRCGRRSRPPSAGATWPATRRSWRGATRSRRRARSARTPRAELEAIAAELSPMYGRCRCSPPRPGCGPRSGWRSSAATWTARRASLNVRRTVSSGEVVELGKTAAQPPPGAARRAGRSTRSTRCRRGSTRRCCSRPRAAGCSTWTTSAAASGHRRSRRPAIATPARIYDLRSTFASQRARGRRVRVRAGADHGHERRG